MTWNKIWFSHDNYNVEIPAFLSWATYDLSDQKMVMQPRAFDKI